jgi:hypothetical protein
LARELDCRVEDLFILDMPENGQPVTLAEKAVFSGARVSVVRIRNRLIAYPMDGK